MSTSPHQTGPLHHHTRSGVAYGLAAYLFWGFVPVYFKVVSHVPALEVLAHRILWSWILLSLAMLMNRRWHALKQIMSHRRTRYGLFGSTLLVTINWFVFIWAVGHGQVLQASLGYFINPLVNVLLGFVFLQERLRPAQRASVLLATLGVLYLGFSYGQAPWIALVLAFTFGFYGLIRKTVQADALGGLMIETMLMTPLALGYLFILWGNGSLVLLHLNLQTDLLLMASGVTTALPLWWFAKAARRLRYATVGFLQYIAPSLQFLLAVAAYGELFTRTHLVSFVCIWTALALYSYDTWRASRSTQAPDDSSQ
jgi:chloramphenicol-sensitive protein RarD